MKLAILILAIFSLALRPAPADVRELIGELRKTEALQPSSQIAQKYQVSRIGLMDELFMTLLNSEQLRLILSNSQVITIYDYLESETKGFALGLSSDQLGIVKAYMGLNDWGYFMDAFKLPVSKSSLRKFIHYACERGKVIFFCRGKYLSTLTPDGQSLSFRSC